MKFARPAGMAVAALIALGASAQAQLAVRTFVTGLGQTLALAPDPTNQSVIFVVQKTGEIRVILNGTVQNTNFLDLSNEVSLDGERGLLGLTFAPDYATSRNLYVDYTDLNGDTHIARFTRSATNPLVADRASEYPILIVPQLGGFNNHKGGTLKFADDGYLYIGMGDGGSGFDPNNNAQNPANLLGKMLRIDPSHDDFPLDPNRNYAIPPTNPFVHGTFQASPEIWAFGYRNPFKWSFDTRRFGGLGGMIVGDVGQNSYEEIDYEPSGAGGKNYGWRMREGLHSTGLNGWNGLPLTDPIFEYAHDGGGRAIIGGYIYHANVLGLAYQDRYFYADFVQSHLYSVKINIPSIFGRAFAVDLRDHTAEIGGAGAIPEIASIDQDIHGELYLTLLTGTILKLVHA